MPELLYTLRRGICVALSAVRMVITHPSCHRIRCMQYLTGVRLSAGPALTGV